jgi:hypothetical protein
MILSLALLAVSAFTSPSGAAALRPAAQQLVANKVADSYDSGYQAGTARGAALSAQYGCGSQAYNTAMSAAIRQAGLNSRDPNNPDQIYWSGYVAGLQDFTC